jgi:CO/xanthine dehydrogenase Mo-binding subunit
MTKFGLAQPVRRVEDFRFLVGAGHYTDDIVRPGLLHGIVLRSPHAAARINKVDTTTALSLDGVKAIYAGRLFQQYPPISAIRSTAIEPPGSGPKAAIAGGKRLGRCERARLWISSAMPILAPTREQPAESRHAKVSVEENDHGQ